MNKKIFVQSFRIAIAVLFVFSAISKIISLPFFDGLVAKLFIGKDYYDHPEAFLFVQLFTRLIIAGEMLLGVAILQRKYLKKVVLPTILGILALFTIHLFYEGFTDKFIGGNCGCFGDLVPMDNFESIIKNLIAISLVIYIWKNYDDKEELRFRSWVFSGVGGSVTLATLLLTVKDVGQKVTLKEYASTESETIDEDTLESEKAPDLDSQYVAPTDTVTIDEGKSTAKDEPVAKTNKTQAEEKPKQEKATVKEKKMSIFSRYTAFQNEGGGVDLDKGQKMICMFSLTCGHCQEAYRDICAMADQGGFPPIYLFLYGDSEDQLNYFFNQAGCKHPYIFIKDYIEFERLLEGKDFPRVLDRKDGVNQQEWDLESYSKESLANYFGLEVPQEEGNGLGF